MSYRTDLIDRIKDSEKWPSFDRLAFLADLNTLAEEVLAKNTTDWD